MPTGLFLPLFDELADPLAVADLASVAETAGWDGVFVWDHISYRAPVRAVADPWVTLAAMAGSTRSLRLGPLVTPLPRRRPAVVARATATLDRLSAGRLVLGVGIGGDGSGELSGTGEELDTRVRAELLDEQLEILSAAWTGEPVHHRSRHYRVEGIRFEPVPVQRPRPPVWVAARYGNPAPLRRAARWDGVFPIDMKEPEQLAEVVAGVRAHRPRPGFDVVATGRPGRDPAPWRAAGATWWLVGLGAEDCRLDTARGVAIDGPPA